MKLDTGLNQKLESGLLYGLGVTVPLWLSAIWMLIDPSGNSESVPYYFGSLAVASVVFVGLGVWRSPTTMLQKLGAALLAIPLWLVSCMILVFVLVYLGHMTQ